MAAKQEKRVWQVGEEEFLIELWQKYDCLYKTSCADFKKVDKREAAREDVRKRIETEMDSTFTGKVYFFFILQRETSFIRNIQISAFLRYFIVLTVSFMSVGIRHIYFSVWSHNLN